jgi:hypothetical protein
MKTNQTSTAAFTRTRLVVLFALLLLSSVGVFGQNVKTIAAPAVAVEVSSDNTVASAEAAASTLNFVSWFMGTKQNVNAASSTEVTGNSKKQMINSGIAPSRLLIKAFLKKASNYASTVA